MGWDPSCKLPAGRLYRISPLSPHYFPFHARHFSPGLTGNNSLPLPSPLFCWRALKGSKSMPISQVLEGGCKERGGRVGPKSHLQTENGHSASSGPCGWTPAVHMCTQTPPWPAPGAHGYGTRSSAHSSEKSHWNHPALQTPGAVARAPSRGALGRVLGHTPQSASDKEDSTPPGGVESQVG